MHEMSLQVETLGELRVLFKLAKKVLITKQDYEAAAVCRDFERKCMEHSDDTIVEVTGKLN